MHPSFLKLYAKFLKTPTKFKLKCKSSKFIGLNSNFSPVPRPLNEGENQTFLLGPPQKHVAGRKTLILDLDETLVHSSFKPIDKPDITLPVEIEGQVCTIFVLVRPFVA
jgi:RNA polymerase II subunit A small phosphatase-like protein